MIIQEFRITMNKCPFFHNCQLPKIATYSNFNWFVNCPEYKIKKDTLTKEKLSS